MKGVHKINILCEIKGNYTATSLYEYHKDTSKAIKFS